MLTDTTATFSASYFLLIATVCGNCSMHGTHQPDEKEAVEAFLKTKDAAFEHLISKYGVGQEGFEAFELGDGGIPHYKLYDRSGRLRYRSERRVWPAKSTVHWSASARPARWITFPKALLTASLFAWLRERSAQTRSGRARSDLRFPSGGEHSGIQKFHADLPR